MIPFFGYSSRQVWNFIGGVIQFRGGVSLLFFLASRFDILKKLMGVLVSSGGLGADGISAYTVWRYTMDDDLTELYFYNPSKRQINLDLAGIKMK